MMGWLNSMAALLLMLLLGNASGCWAGDAVTPGEYTKRLEQIDAALASGDAASAKVLSSCLPSLTVSWEGGELAADPTIDALIRKSSLAAARLRIHAVLDALPTAAGKHSVAPDAHALADIAQRESDRLLVLRNGGKIEDLHMQEPAVARTLRERIADLLLWIHDKFVQFFEWLKSLFKSDKSGEDRDSQGSNVVPLTMIVVGVIIVLVVLMAWQSSRNRRLDATQVTSSSSPRHSKADADPRSRPADEWLAYAQRLAAEGRHREATRAWYHALLVQCWSQGLIHHRIGKTNWEYALGLSTALEWRKQFHELTRHYDRIWYGGQVDAVTVGEFSRDAKVILAHVRLQLTEGG